MRRALAHARPQPRPSPRRGPEALDSSRGAACAAKPRVEPWHTPATQAQRHSPCASQPPRGLSCGAVQCRGAPRLGSGRPRPRRHTDTVSARGKPTTSRLKMWCCPVSRCSATGRPMLMRHAGTVSARVAARQATGARTPGTPGCQSPARAPATRLARLAASPPRAHPPPGRVPPRALGVPRPRRLSCDAEPALSPP